MVPSSGEKYNCRYIAYCSTGSVSRNLKRKETVLIYQGGKLFINKKTYTSHFNTNLRKLLLILIM